MRLTAALLSFIAAAVHAWVALPHADEWLLAGVFFVGVAVGQALLAAAVFSAPPGLLSAAAAANAGSIALYAFSRTVGMPFGPHAGTAEAVAPIDLVAKGAEAMLVVVLGALARALAGVSRADLWPVRRRPVTLAVALVAVVAGTGSAWSDPGNAHGHDAPVHDLVSDENALVLHDHDPFSDDLLPLADEADHIESDDPPDEGEGEEHARPCGIPQPAAVGGAANGARLVYEWDGDLYLYDEGMDSPTALTDDAHDCAEHSPVFKTPTVITFERHVHEGDEEGSTILYDFDLVTGSVTEVMRARNISTWAWDPSGRRIAYLDWGSGERGPTIRSFDTMERSNDVVRMMGETVEAGCGGGWDEETYLGWSADGTMIVAVMSYLMGNDHVFVMDLEGTDVIEPRNATHARLTPDGKTLIMRQYDDESERRWYAIDLASDEKTRLAMRRGTHSIAVSPDGTRIAHNTDDGNLRLFDMEGEDRELAEGYANPTWVGNDSLVAMQVEPCEGCDHGAWETADRSALIDIETGDVKVIPIPATWNVHVAPTVPEPEADPPVDDINDAPVIDPIDAQQATALEELRFAVHASDPDGDRVTLAAANLPEGARFDPDNGFSWRPTPDQEGAWTVRFVATDGERTAVEDVTITVEGPAGSTLST